MGNGPHTLLFSGSTVLVAFMFRALQNNRRKVGDVNLTALPTKPTRLSGERSRGNQSCCFVAPRPTHEKPPNSAPLAVAGSGYCNRQFWRGLALDPPRSPS